MHPRRVIAVCRVQPSPDDFFRYGEEYEPLLRIVDIVKIDVLMLGDDALAKLVKQLRLWPPRLLAA